MEPIKIKGLIIGTALGSGMTYLFSKKRINKIREIINSKKQNEFGKRNYIDLNISNNKAEEKNEEKVKVIMTPVFATEEQEKSFFQASRRHLTDGKKLEWDEEKNEEGKVIMTPVFATKEQEESFAKSARESMRKRSKLEDLARDLNCEREEKVIKSYILMNKLKDVVRTGWKDWNVERERVESIAEHVYGVQQLALIMYLTYKEEYKDLDLNKIILMLAIHETEEAFIGDITMFQKESETKEERGHKAIHEFFSRFMDGKMLEDIILEFDKKETKEAKFAYQCDKLECDIQAALYNDNVDLNDQEDNKSFHDEKVQKLLKQGMSFGEMWLSFGQKKYPYDNNFRNVSKYAKENIKKLKNIRGD